MATYTGPDINTYAIPEVQLGDTFNLWRDVTNTAVYKLNKLRIYDGVSSGSITVNTSQGGTASLTLNADVTTGHTFSGNINFGGIVTFNSPVVTINSNVVTIDDYNIVLGDTAEARDSNIGVGGGGLLLNRIDGPTAEWLWKPVRINGATGVWTSNAHIGLCGSASGVYPVDGTLKILGTSVRLQGASTDGAESGLSITLAGNDNSDRRINFNRYSSTGSTTAFEILNGTTYGSQPFVNIRNGANRKRISQVSHGLTFGTPVYLTQSGSYAPASCVDVEKAEVIGVVSSVVSTDVFDVTYLGEIHGAFANVLISGSALATGGVYYLSSESGKLATTPSTAAGTVHKAVFIATGEKSATVIPFTGGLLADDTAVSSAATVARTVFQLNKFKVGDALRWIAGATGLSYSYAGGGHTYTSTTFYDGIFVKGQANTQEQAEVIGIVSSVSPIDAATNTGKPPVNYKFTLMTNGYFNESRGICADIENMVGGQQYFLATNCAGTSGCLESAVPSLTVTPPSANGTVKKPLLFSGTTTSGYILLYRGDVNNDTQPVFTGYTGSLANKQDLPIGSVVMGLTGFTTGLPPNSGVTLYYHDTGGFSGDYVIATSTSNIGVLLSGSWKTRGKSVVSGGAGGATAYFLCQRIS